MNDVLYDTRTRVIFAFDARRSDPRAFFWYLIQYGSVPTASGTMVWREGQTYFGKMTAVMYLNLCQFSVQVDVSCKELSDRSVWMNNELVV
jgi:hypothetical protein